MTNDFSMISDYWELKIDSANYQEIKMILIFKKEVIPEQQLRLLEQHIRMILIGCGRLDQNPSRR